MLRDRKPVQIICVVANFERCISVEQTKIVSSCNEEIEEIISPPAFTFKIPFH